MSDCSFKHELFSLFALLQSSEKINSEPKCQWVQAQVQYAGQYALLHQTTHLKCHKLRLFVNNLKKKCLWLCLFLYALWSAQASQHPDASPASGPAQPLHCGPAATGCVRPDRLLPPDVSPHTSQSWSAGEMPTCVLKCRSPWASHWISMNCKVH